MALAVAESAILLLEGGASKIMLTQRLQKPLAQRFIERSKVNKMEGKFECGERERNRIERVSYKRLHYSHRPVSVW